MKLELRKSYAQISFLERKKIEKWHYAGVPVDIIAGRLNRHRSTIYRELKRNYFEDKEFAQWSGYFCVIANDRARNRRYHLSKIKRFPELKSAILERLKGGWTPEQIAGRLKYEMKTHYCRLQTVCHETIYRFVYSADGIEQELWKLLPEHRRRRRARHRRRQYKQRFATELSILNRPDTVQKRKQFGHWECDLIQFRQKYGKSNITSLVERVSRFAVFVKNNDRKSKPVMEKLINVMSALPFKARRSITFDRGTEFTEWAYLQAGIGAQTWFCDPQSPWQKGTVENTNRRVRRWLSRDVDPMSISDMDLMYICDQLNNTPRKCLGYKTPAEIFRKKIMDSERNLR